MDGSDKTEMKATVINPCIMEGHEQIMINTEINMLLVHPETPLSD